MTKPSTVSTSRASGRLGRRGSTGPQPYDFRRPIKLSREHLRHLQIVFETYARGCGTLFTTRLRALSQVNVVAVEQVTYEEYAATLNNPTLLAAVSLDPLPGTMLLEMTISTGMAAIDHMLGGSGGSQPERQLSDVEMPLLRSLLERMLAELRYGFASLVDLQPKLGVIEYNPQFVRVIAPGDAVVVASFEMKVGTEESVSTICLPFNTILPALQTENNPAELTTGERDSLRNAQRNLAAGLSAAPLDVAVRFQGIRMRTDDIVELRLGDVVPLSHSVTAPLTITVNDISFAYAVPGNQGARLACLVVPPPPKENR